MSGRLIFLGTASICLPFLEALKKAFDLSLIISQPDRPSGRNRTICFSCVKTFAIENQIPFLQPNSLADENIVGQIHSLSPDIAVVMRTDSGSPHPFSKFRDSGPSTSTFPCFLLIVEPRRCRGQYRTADLKPAFPFSSCRPEWMPVPSGDSSRWPFITRTRQRHYGKE
jgi:hypothetical protein